VCLIRGDSSSATNHEVNHRHPDDGCTEFRQQFILLMQTAVASDLTKGARDNPAHGNDHKPLDGVGALGNLQANWPW
jgi:hypothetical protein